MQLERFYKAKQAEIAQLRQLAERDLLPTPFAGHRAGFAEALRRGGAGPVAVIAEYKRASPSRGIICQDVSVDDVARQYAEAGASCLSILTEEDHFDGKLEFLELAHNVAPATPLLRKDFIFDSLQIRATAATPASALLLIVRLTPDVAVLRQLREEAASFGIASVVEVFGEDDLLLARESGAEIIQVNARDLQTFAVDRNACLALARTNPPRNGEIWIQASGVSKPSHLLEAREAGFAAALVGTALMEYGKPGAALAALLANPDTSAQNGTGAAHAR